MNKGTDLIEALNQVAKEKNIDKEIIFDAIETSLVSACKKNFGTSQNIKVIIDRELGDVKVFAQKEVTEDPTDVNLQISLENARKISPNYEIGDVVDIVVTPKNFGRISAQTAKQVVVQKFREAEREILYNEFITKEKEIMTGIVQRKDRKNVIIALGKIDALLPQSEQIPGEEYDFQSRIKVYVYEVKQTTKGPVINVSRTHPELVKKLFEQEVPEVSEGIVEIKSISREPGIRSKIAVYSNNPNVDAVGACVGQNGCRVNVIVSELRGEKIDIINWSADPRQYIAQALSPSKVLAVALNDQDQSAKIVVPDNQLSLAIGREGQNARLTAKLTGWRIDIRSQTQAEATNFINFDENNDLNRRDEYEDDFDGDFEDDFEENFDDDFEIADDDEYSVDYDLTDEDSQDSGEDSEFDDDLDYDEDYSGEYSDTQDFPNDDLPKEID